VSVSEMRSDAGLFGQYAGTAHEYDEVFAAPGKLRPHWRRFVELTAALGKEEFARRWVQARRLLEQQGLTYPDPSDPAGQRRPWELDPYPLLLAANEWRKIAAAMQQRATLLWRVLAARIRSAGARLHRLPDAASLRGLRHSLAPQSTFAKRQANPPNRGLLDTGQVEADQAPPRRPR